MKESFFVVKFFKNKKKFPKEIIKLGSMLNREKNRD
jgi:hypothetical protein